MRVNITVHFDIVDIVNASDTSVDQADLAASGMDAAEVAHALVDAIETRASAVRGKRKPGTVEQPISGPDYGGSDEP
jgi:hypothetical protein